MPKYAELIYNGFWFAPERELLQTLIDKSQEFVAGRVRLKLYKGGVILIGRDSPIRSTIRTSSPSRKARSPTTTTTRPASSSSTRCGCARWPSGSARRAAPEGGGFSQAAVLSGARRTGAAANGRPPSAASR